MNITVVLYVTTEPVVVYDEYYMTINSARFAINFVLTPIFCIFGVVGNVLNIIVLRSCGYKDSNVLLLESLTLADLLLSVVHSFIHLHYIVECFDFVVASLVGTFSFIYLFVPYQVLLCVVECHLAGVAFERVIAVYFPFHVARLFLKSRVLIYICIMYVFSIIVNIPTLLVFEPQWVNVTSINRLVAVVGPTQYFLLNYEDMNNYLIMGLSVINTVILPCVTVLGCVAVGLKLLMRRRHTIRRAKIGDTHDLKGMRLLVAVCLVSVFYCIPGLTLNYFFYVYKSFTGPLHELMLDVSNFIGQFYSSTNFFIYVTMSRKFYRTYRKLICRF
ncbi:uncharacterized protein LOC129925114 [Biomphalaria glabrata]|uniref:Uncharacterized protein LOC129925114 n=1 Tax=Biomphalaria glabrata TaxID=6526 RepID=A0A9W2ZWP5_BIOGL|nr:uncharacterized protein LOC129925114 [Biomphalaria glabrata]